DGVLPSNEGRGYVLRRIMRRALRHGRLLGINQPFLYKLIPVLIQTMGDAYGELAAQESLSTPVIRTEEQRFIATLDGGLRLLEEALAPLSAGGVLDGQAIFTLYDTYGFPTDLTADIARDRLVSLDMVGFARLMDEQRKRARAAWAGSGDAKISHVFHELREKVGASEFLGYLTETAEGAVIALVKDGKQVDALEEGWQGEVVTNQTPFYAESGGQCGDCGVISWEGGSFQVSDTFKPVGDLFVHRGKVVQGRLTENQPVTLQVDQERRGAIRLHHSATHLLHHALRKVLGTHVKQAGSMVAADRLRFDFSHFQALTSEELAKIEEMVNAAILANARQETTVMSPDEAVAKGAMALFGEKYGEQVRVVTIGDSVELCGGTHVSRSGDIGLCRIVSEGAVSAGMRRIEAVCGQVARHSFVEDARRLKEAASLLKLPPDRLGEGLDKLLARQKELERALEQARGELAGNVVDTLLAKTEQVQGISLLTSRVNGVESRELRDLLDRIRDRLASGVILLALVEGGKVTLVAGVTKDLIPRLSAGALIQTVAPLVGGKGGGKPDMAMGGGDRPADVDKALQAARQWLAEKCSG
ncbi:MAG: alanine--tRNA ligase, partial [Magnetococcales bacterium]|nr:alanine--tRNA ligase [Magnetococcales bacterium]